MLLWILIDSQLKCKILLTWHELGTSFSSFISSYSVHPQINELLSTPYLFPNVLFSSPRNSPSVFVSLCCTHYVGSQFPLPYLLSVATLEALWVPESQATTPILCFQIDTCTDDCHTRLQWTDDIFTFPNRLGGFLEGRDCALLIVISQSMAHFLVCVDTNKC